MKKFIHASLLATCLVLLTGSSLIAQDVIKNNTDCLFRVRLAYGPVGPSCNATGFIDVFVSGGTAVNAGIPAGTEIKYTKGAYTFAGSLSCPFYIGLSCSPYPLAVGVSCSTFCGSYKAKLIPGTGILIYN
ncbi:MAG: hypothetical protein AAF985_17250 [Bacteroidota bacterium]